MLRMSSSASMSALATSISISDIGRPSSRINWEKRLQSRTGLVLGERVAVPLPLCRSASPLWFQGGPAAEQ